MRLKEPMRTVQEHRLNYKHFIDQMERNKTTTPSCNILWIVPIF